MLDVYARLSRAVNGETIQVDDQVELCTEKIAARGAVVGEVFKDNSLSAWNPKVVRPNWDRLMARLESGASDGVMVYDLFRFSRKIMEGERLVELAARGIRVWALAGEYDLTTADGRRHFREAMVAAAAESDKISERVKRGNVRRARKGRPHGSGPAWATPRLEPVGPDWETGDLRRRVPADVIEAERKIAAECVARLLAGESVRSVVLDLNERGHRGERACLPVSGKDWTLLTLSRTLRRPAIAGLLAFDGKIVGSLANVEPIVSREEWERLCALFDARKTGRPPVARHLLTGVLECGNCGHPMRVWLRSNRGTYPDGSPRKSYRCPPWDGVGAPRCGHNGIDGQVAERAVVLAVRTRLGDPRHAAALAAYSARIGSERQRLETSLAGWEEQATQLAGKTVSWGVARVDAAMAPILIEIDRLRAELAELATPDATVAMASADAVAMWDQARDLGDVVTQRKIIRRAFPRLALASAAHRGDQSVGRLLWNGAAAERTEHTA